MEKIPMLKKFTFFSSRQDKSFGYSRRTLKVPALVRA